MIRSVRTRASTQLSVTMARKSRASSHMSLMSAVPTPLRSTERRSTLPEGSRSARYTLTLPRVSLERTDSPTCPARASATSGRSRWLDMVASSPSESYRTVPSGATSVARTSPKSREASSATSSEGSPPARSSATTSLSRASTDCVPETSDSWKTRPVTISATAAIATASSSSVRNRRARREGCWRLIARHAAGTPRRARSRSGRSAPRAWRAASGRGRRRCGSRRRSPTPRRGAGAPRG